MNCGLVTTELQICESKSFQIMSHCFTAEKCSYFSSIDDWLILINVCLFTDSKILIIGAGMSGVSAGKKLFDSGYRNVQILEASNRIGGRVLEEDIQGHQVELGALWIYGRGSNPIYNLAMKYNMSFNGDYNDDWTVYNDAGEIVNDAATIAYGRLTKAMQKLSLLAANAREMKMGDFSVRSGLRHVGWRPKTPLDDVVEIGLNDWEDGIEPCAVSGKYHYTADMFKEFGNSDLLLVNDQRGFSYMVKQLAEEMNDTADRFIFNQTIGEIKYNANGVTVTTTEDNVHTADYVIVTVSLGVLQQRLLTFVPPLTESKQMAIDKFGMSQFTFIYVKYHESFWDNTMFLIYAGKQRGKMSIWINMNVALPGSNMLQVSLVSDFARWVAFNSDKEVLDEVKSTLKRMYPNRTIPDPLDYKISTWALDPLFMGAFSYWPSGFTEHDMEILGQNVGRMYFAGEHTHPMHYGFLHGAYLAGERAANDVMDCIKDKNTCVESDLDNKTSSGSTFNLCICLLIYIQITLHLNNRKT